MSNITVEEVMTALRAGGYSTDERHRQEAEYQAAAANRSPEGRAELRKTLAQLRQGRAFP
ncbi:hypothetical protein MCW82_07240 [Azospirillum doebereinerae]|uniref:hypothetical protein n=1 Tax=Azospirillum doebereinerae TaxID=92933 RepID=UPI001EE5FB71|nr:hypothetical protein [Azospirillum doebereinerae]MCG5239562.1 hypothetical protein [Azospirillum doebereinerae]